MPLSRVRPRHTFPLLILLVLGGLFWQGPLLIKRIPSRYLARLPQPVQTLTAPPAPAPLLPTVSAPRDAARLLQPPSGSLSGPEALPPPLVTVSDEMEGRSASTPSPESEPPATPTATVTHRPAPSATRLEGFRHQFQTWNNCGPATIAMGLSYFGLDLDQQETAAVLKPDPEDRNVSPYEMVAYVRSCTPSLPL